MVAMFVEYAPTRDLLIILWKAYVVFSIRQFSVNGDKSHFVLESVILICWCYKSFKNWIYYLVTKKDSLALWASTYDFATYAEKPLLNVCIPKHLHSPSYTSFLA